MIEERIALLEKRIAELETRIVELQYLANLNAWREGIQELPFKGLGERPPEPQNESPEPGS